LSSSSLCSARSSIPYEPDALAGRPNTLLTALEHYSAAREQSYKVKAVDPETVQVEQWLNSLKDSNEVHASYEMRQLQTHTANVICCKFQPKEGSELFATGSADKSIAICDASSNQVLRRVTASGPVLSMHFNPKRPELLLATCMNGGHSILDVSKENPEHSLLQSLVEHKKYVVCGKWNPAGTHYVTGSHDGTVQLYGPSTPSSAIAAASSSSSSSPVSPVIGWRRIGQIEFSANVEAVEWIDAESFYVAVREDNYLHHIGIASGDLRELSKYNTNEFGDDHISFSVLDMALAPGGNAVMLATDHHRVILMQAASGHQIRNFYNLPNDGYSTPRLAFSPGGKFAYVTCQDKTVGVMEVAAGKVVHRMKGHEINVRDVSVQPCSGRVLTCSFDKSARVWAPEVE
jgi:WD40 repeat protein